LLNSIVRLLSIYAQSADADKSGRDEILAEHPQIGGAADEVRVVRVHVAEAFLGAFATRDGLDNLAVEFAHTFLHGGFAQGFRNLVVPQAQVEVLSLAKLSNPRGALLLEVLALPARDFDEVNRRDAVDVLHMGDFVFEVLDTFPLAILALEIRGREVGEQQARFAESLEDALPLTDIP